MCEHNSKVVRCQEKQNLATLPSRFLGALLDEVIIYSVVVGIFFMLGFYEQLTLKEMFLSAENIGKFFIIVIIYLILNGYLIYTRGQTIGKIICGTKVVTMDGKRVSGNRYFFLRVLPLWCIAQIPIIGRIIGIIDALLIFRKDRNCLHDDIAKTRVVVARSQ